MHAFQVQNGSKVDCCRCIPVSEGSTSPKVPELFASFPSANSPDQSGTMETNVDGCGGKRMGTG